MGYVNIILCLYCFSYYASGAGYHGNINRRGTNLKSVARNQPQNVTKIPNLSQENLVENEVFSDCGDFWTCVQIELLKNVSEIVKKDEYNLTSSLILEKYPGSEVKRFISRADLQKIKDPDKRDFGFVTALLMEKTLGIFRSHSLKWTFWPGLDIRLFQENNGNVDIALEIPNRESRTFGGPRKRLMFLLMPMLYKMGVMTTMLGGLMVLTLKMLTIGVILLILAVNNSFKSKGHGYYPSPYQHAPTDIHVHVHADPHLQAYSGWHHDSYHSEQPGHYHRRRWPPQQPVFSMQEEPLY